MIKQQTGIDERRWVAPGEGVVEMALLAARSCLENAGALATEVGLMLVSSGSAEGGGPCTAASSSGAGPGA